MMYLRVHEKEAHTIVAICDDELIGKVLVSQTIHMDLDRCRGFYIGEKASKTDVKKALLKFDSANLVGWETVGIALELGLVKEDELRYVEEVPYIQIYKI